MTTEAGDKVLEAKEVFEAEVVEILEPFEKETHSTIMDHLTMLNRQSLRLARQYI